MSIFYPHYFFKRIYHIPPEFFRENKIDALLLDVDNTLTTDNNPVSDEHILEWLKILREEGMRMMVLSNNTEERVAPFAQSLGLEYIAQARKPFPGKVKKALYRLGVEPHRTALIGDQLFTDILCGRLTGCTAILVDPFELENYGFYVVKRWLERPILRRYHRKEGKNR